ncbi:MAG: hypothetical protein ABI045_00365 [Flavobacteriales bacterium]
MRLRADILDLILPISRGKYIGLGIELKIKPNKLIENQSSVGEKLQEQDWKVQVYYYFYQVR